MAQGQGASHVDKGSSALIRDFIADWNAWSRAEHWIAVTAAILLIALVGLDAAAG